MSSLACIVYSPCDNATSDIAVHAVKTIFVDRNDPDSRKKCIDEINCRAKHSESCWPQILIFLEGATHNGEALLQFKKGAFIPGLPLQVQLK